MPLIRRSLALALLPLMLSRLSPGQQPNAIEFEQRADRLLFLNRHVRIEFQASQQGFRLAQFHSRPHRQDFLAADPAEKAPNLIQIVMKIDPSLQKRGETGTLVVGHLNAKAASFRRTGDASASTLHLEWKDIDLKEDKAAMDLEVSVTLKADDPLSYWRFSIKNRSIRYGIERVYFPVLNLAPIGEAKDNVYIYPSVRGRLVEDPFHLPPGYDDGVHRSGRYPAAFGMQFQALYNKQTGAGLYLGTQDPTPNLKNTEAPNSLTHITWKPGHFPPNIGFANQDYSLPYDCVVGSFAGEWWDACQIYRAWALKQSWCRKGPLATRDDVPKWYKEPPLFLVAGSWLNDGNVPKTVEHYLKFLKWAGVRLPCNWYGWKLYRTELTAYDVPHSYWRSGYRNRQGPCGNSHDGNYPKLPALPSFAAACKQLRKAGGMVNPYVCLQIYDQGPVENAPYVNDARPHVIRDTLGNMQTYGREPSWAMCAWSPWWRERLKETCVTLLKKERVGGFYLDTMHGTGEPCHWTPHGHSACGGSAGLLGMHGLCQHVRDAVKAVDPEVITTGEDSAENVMDVIDGKLYQFTLTPKDRAPLFAAVYNDYIPRYGMTLAADKGERFFMEAASLFVEGAQMGRLSLEPMTGGLSFENPEHKEMVDFLGRLVAYYRQDVARKFLCYGQLMRPLSFQRPDPMPTLSHESDGRAVTLPALLSGVFRARDGELAAFIVNIGKAEIPFASAMGLSRYGLQPTVPVDVEGITLAGIRKPYLPGAKDRLTLEGKLPPRETLMFRRKP